MATFLIRLLLLTFLLFFSSCSGAKKEGNVDIKGAEVKLIGKGYGEVEDLLGKPIATSKFDSQAVSPKLSDQEREEMQSKIESDIWVYNNFKVVFSLNGKVIKVDNKHLDRYKDEQK